MTGKLCLRVYITQYKDSAFVKFIISGLGKIYSQPNQGRSRAPKKKSPTICPRNGAKRTQWAHADVWLGNSLSEKWIILRTLHCGTVPVDTKITAFILKEIRVSFRAILSDHDLRTQI